ncbi:MAG: N-acetylmuramoyl-L-alanine amidase, partial [Anaerovibrio sp.]|nr:N-acetylmuramoyl-L-alanine amidase [Anaerovibrio sp.]
MTGCTQGQGVHDQYTENIPETSSVPMPHIQDRPVINTPLREELIREYTQKHYGEAITEIVPQAVVIHWTASDSAEGTYKWFNREEYTDGTLNVCSQFLVDRDGTIYRLTPETFFCRHIIGYNWCSIGIENVGGVNGAEDLTQEQATANIALIRYLHAKYP